MVAAAVLVESSLSLLIAILTIPCKSLRMSTAADHMEHVYTCISVVCR